MFEFLKSKDKASSKKDIDDSFEVDSLNLEDRLDENKVVVELQPQISVNGDVCIGAEALSRYVDDNNNMIGPMMFLPILESSSVVSELDYTVVKQVAAKLEEWRKAGKEPMPVAINFSRADFSEKGFLEKVDACFDEHGVDKNFITIEIRESSIADSYEFMYNRLKWLHGKGYRIAIDDFGRENNLFFKMADLPVDIIKFDRVVLYDSIHTERGKMMMAHMVEGFSLAGYDIICEGVETEEQKAVAMDLGIRFIQGFLYDKPMSMDAFEEKYTL